MAPALVTASAAVSAVAANWGLGWVIEPPSAPDAAELLVASTELEERPSLMERPRRRLDQETYVNGILDRNIFDQSKIGVVEEIEKGGDGMTTTLTVELRGTVVAEPVSFSAAFIAKDGEKSAYAYGIGQSISGATILEIYDERVKIMNNGREEWLTLGDGKTEERPASKTPALTDDEDVSQTGDNEFTVARSMLDEHLNDLEGLSRMGRALLHRGPDGDFDGYRLSAIRRGSLPDKLGIRNGDIIHNVNGMDLNSVQGAMQALQTLQSENSLKFEVTRRGQPVALNYVVE
jgi:type II secretion system protein C